MALNVNAAFAEFMRSTVNLTVNDYKQAKEDVQELYSEIYKKTSNNFFCLYKDINMYFGSFARKTKCQPLNDVDVMFGISAQGATYTENSWDDIIMTPSVISKAQQGCKNSDGFLDSNMVLGKVKSLLTSLADLRSCEIKKNHEAIVFNIKKRDWSFDIVPCFYTKPQSDGRQYYLIPDGKGNWKKTDPTIDKNHMLELAKLRDNMLPAIRLFKWWNKHSKTLTIEGYVMECLLAQYFENNESSEYIDCDFISLLKYFYYNITNPIPDPKGIQDDLNYLDNKEASNLAQKAYNVYLKAVEAQEAERVNQQKAINLWRNIFGDDFPTYG